MKKIIEYGVIALLVASLLFAINKCNTYKNKYKDIDKALSEAKNDTFTKKVVKNDTIYQQVQNKVSKNSSVAELKKKVSHLKEINKSLELKIRSSIPKDTLSKVFYKDTLKNNKDTSTKNSYKIAKNEVFSFEKNTKWYGYKFTVGDRIIQDSLYFNTDLDIYWGIEDHGSWVKNTFKTNKPVVNIKSNNPYLEISGKNYTFKDYKRNNFSLGIQGGYGVNSSGLSPYVGIGIQYNVLNFKL